MKKLLLTLFMVFALVGCGETTTTEEPFTYPEMDYFSFLNQTLSEPDDQLTQEESTYYIYIYGSSCSHCSSIKNEVLYTIEFLTEDTVYIVKQIDQYSVHDDIQDAYRADQNSTSPGVGTPSLYKIVDGEVAEVFVAATEVLNELHSLS